MRAAASVTLLLLLSACSGSEPDPYDLGFEEGYNAGQYDVCREVDGFAPGVKDNLRNCRGY